MAKETKKDTTKKGKAEKKDSKLTASEKKEIIEDIKKAEDNIEKEEKKEEKTEKPSKEQIKSENRTLAIVLGVLLLLAAAFVGYLIFSSNAKSFTYNGVGYTLSPSGKLMFYETTIPVVQNGKKTNYPVYIQNDPRKLESEVPFNGSLYIRPAMAVNYSNGISCDGFGSVAIANLFNLYQTMGVKTVYDPNATCDSQRRYVYVNIKTSNETSIQEDAPACYTINVADCNVLPAVERYMTETFQTLHDYLNSSS